MDDLQSTKPIYHFYHIWIGGLWQEIVTNHITYLKESKLIDRLDGFYIGLVGSETDRQTAKLYLDTKDIKYTVIAEADVGYEQVTINALYEFSRDHEGYVLYAHNKASWNKYYKGHMWRLSMSYYCIVKWRTAVNKLKDADIVGCHWMVPNMYTTHKVTSPYFGGNFWWARLSHLQTLGYCSDASRYDAESWIGTKHNIKVVDLNPGVPDRAPFVINWGPEQYLAENEQ